MAIIFDGYTIEPWPICFYDDLRSIGVVGVGD
jgi:hypothetical protein